MTASINDLIVRNRSKVFRQAFIKRRIYSTGLFEENWFEITKYVKSWGTISKEIDIERPNRFRFGGVTLKLRNDNAEFNPEDDESSLWYGYASRNRTLIKIVSGFVDEEETTGLIRQSFLPGANFIFDISLFDDAVFETSNAMFTGIILGDCFISSGNEVQIKAQPLQQIFREYPAQLLSGYTSTGITASQFVGMLRDQTDGSSNYVFRPFFSSTVTAWNFTTTSITYGNLNTTGAADVIDNNCWDVLEKLAEVENFLVYVDNDGQFNFRSKSIVSTASSFDFYGPGYFNSGAGNVIKNISKFGPATSKFYSRVQVKYREENTSTSYAVHQASLTVSGASAAWNYGLKSYELENTWVPTSTVAENIALNLFTYLSAIKKEIEFSTTFIPHLDLLDIIRISYDGSGSTADPNSLWDLNNWADTAGAMPTGNELYWDGSSGRGDPFKLNNKEFSIIKVDINLDNFETKFLCRET